MVFCAPKIGAYWVDDVVVAPHHRRPREPGRVAEPRAEVPTPPKLIAGDDAQRLGLVEVEETPRGVGVVAALAARQRIGDPPEETVQQLLPKKKLAAVGLADLVLDQRRRDGGDGFSLRDTRSQKRL